MSQETDMSRLLEPSEQFSRVIIAAGYCSLYFRKRKLRFTKVKELSQGHGSPEWQAGTLVRGCRSRDVSMLRTSTFRGSHFDCTRCPSCLPHFQFQRPLSFLRGASRHPKSCPTGMIPVTPPVDTWFALCASWQSVWESDLSEFEFHS